MEVEGEVVMMMTMMRIIMEVEEVIGKEEEGDIQPMMRRTQAVVEENILIIPLVPGSNVSRVTPSIDQLFDPLCTLTIMTDGNLIRKM